MCGVTRERERHRERERERERAEREKGGGGEGERETEIEAEREWKRYRERKREREREVDRKTKRKDAFDNAESLSTSDFTESHTWRFLWHHYTGRILRFCGINLHTGSITQCKNIFSEDIFLV